VRRLRRCLKFEGLERAKKNSPFLGLKAQTVLGQLFCFIRSKPSNFSAKEGLGNGNRDHVPLRGPSLLGWEVAGK
jgi:hypothetical protein